jgi:hypothetical protein
MVSTIPDLYNKIVNEVTKTAVSKFNLESKESIDLIDIKAFEIEKARNKEEAMKYITLIFDQL